MARLPVTRSRCRSSNVPIRHPQEPNDTALKCAISTDWSHRAGFGGPAPTITALDLPSPQASAAPDPEPVHRPPGFGCGRKLRSGAPSRYTHATSVLFASLENWATLETRASGSALTVSRCVAPGFPPNRDIRASNSRAFSGRRRPDPPPKRCSELGFAPVRDDGSQRRSASRFDPRKLRAFQTFLPVSGSRPAYARHILPPWRALDMLPAVTSRCLATRDPNLGKVIETPA